MRCGDTGGLVLFLDAGGTGQVGHGLAPETGQHRKRKSFVDTGHTQLFSGENRPMRHPWVFVMLGLTAFGVPTATEAQLEISSRASSIQIGGRVHAQYAASSVDDANNDFFLRRVRLIADITLNDFASARVQPDFAQGKIALQDVYVRLGFSSKFRVSAGQFKRAFDIFELSSSTDLSIIERDARVEGASGCSGVSGICSYSRLTQKLKYSERDQGIKIDGSSGRVSYQATLTNGTGINVSDENDAKSYSGHLTLAVSENVRVSGQLGVHDYLIESAEASTERGIAWGADVEFGTWRDGAHIQASVIRGDNWKSLDSDHNEATFLTTQIVASYYSERSGRLSGIEPLIRLSFGDPDTAVGKNAGTVVTPGLMFYLQGKSKIGANLDIYSPQSGETALSFKVQTYLYF